MITFAVEQWPDCFQEVLALTHEHWVEVGTSRDKVPLDMDLEQYAALHAAGQYHLVTARSAGAMVGYHGTVVRPHLHYRTTLMGFVDGYFIRPDHRRGRAGVDLFRFVERSLKARGVQKVFTGTKITHDKSAIFARLGWVEHERLHSKWIGD